MLTRLRIVGFKAIKDSGNVNLGPLVLFIGRNGSGKSSFIEGLQWLQESLLLGVDDATQQRFRSYTALKNRRSLGTEIAATFSSGTTEVRYDLYVTSGPHKRPIVSWETCFEGRTSGSVPTIVTTSRHNSFSRQVRASRKGRGLSVRDRDSLALSLAPRVATVGTTRFLSYLNESVFLRLSPTAIAREAPRHRRARGPRLDEEGYWLVNLLSSFTKKQLAEVADRLREIIPGIRSLSIEGNRDIGYLAAHERMKSKGGRRTYEIPAWLLSEGTRRLTALYSLLTLNPRPPLLAIEEIENGLDPWTLEAVFRDLRAASQTGTQILLTTHSPFLLDHVDVREIIHVQRSDGDTSYTPISQYSDVARYLGAVPPGAMYLSDYMK